MSCSTPTYELDDRFARLIVDQGATLQYSIEFRFTDGTVFDLTDYTARMQVRESHSSEDVVLELTTENGGISIDGEDGVVWLLASPETTAALDDAEYVFDIEIISPGGTVTRSVEGICVITPEVTK